jgi:hypothetical protein
MVLDRPEAPSCDVPLYEPPSPPPDHPVEPIFFAPEDDPLFTGVVDWLDFAVVQSGS